jgi:hypothetical protein
MPRFLVIALISLVVVLSLIVAAMVTPGRNASGAVPLPAVPTPRPVFFQQTGPLTTPYRVCNGGDGYSYVPCTTGPVIGSDHPAGGH